MQVHDTLSFSVTRCLMLYLSLYTHCLALGLGHGRSQADVSVMLSLQSCSGWPLLPLSPASSDVTPQQRLMQWRSRRENCRAGSPDSRGQHSTGNEWARDRFPPLTAVISLNCCNRLHCCSLVETQPLWIFSLAVEANGKTKYMSICLLIYALPFASFGVWPGKGYFHSFALPCTRSLP